MVTSNMWSVSQCMSQSMSQSVHPEKRLVDSDIYHMMIYLLRDDRGDDLKIWLT